MLKKSNEHEHAMDFAFYGDQMRSRGLLHAAESSFRKATIYERRAAAKAHMEPSRSILFRSAASCAQCSGDHREAVRLALLGLAGDAPPEISDELLEVALESLGNL